MNIENAKTLVGQLKRLPDEKFDMGDWFCHDTACGTVACLAGWCSILNGGPKDNARGMREFAMAFLDTNSNPFYRSQWPDPKYSESDRVGAIIELERLIVEAERVSA